MRQESSKITNKIKIRPCLERINFLITPNLFYPALLNFLNFLDQVFFSLYQAHQKLLPLPRMTFPL